MSEVSAAGLPRALATAVIACLVLAGALFAGTGAAQARAQVTQPQQPKSGPGGSDYTHKGVRESSGGTGAEAWYVFEPTTPRPKKAPVTIIMHGYAEYAGYDSMSALIRHTVRKGSVAIYPRWQTDIATPCPGPFDIEPCIVSAVNGIKGALDYLRSNPKRVQPQLRKTSYFGFSFGGIVTTNLVNRYQSLGLPKPRAIFLDDPHDGGLTGQGEPALDDSLAGIPPDVKFECHSSADGVTGEPGKEISSCNALFPKLAHIPAKNKDLVLTYTDDHGEPTLSSEHGVCAVGDVTAPAIDYFAPNAYDWNFCWKVWDALRSCALEGTDCKYALGDTRKHRSNGRWSDGVPIASLKIQDTAPIAP